MPWHRFWRKHTTPSSLRVALAIFWRESDSHVKRQLVLALGLVLVSSLLASLGPVMLKLIVDRMAMTDEHGATSSLLLLVLVYIVCHWTGRGLIELRAHVHAAGEQGFLRRLSRRLFSHVLGLPLRFHLERQTGAVGQILENGLLGYRLLLQHMIFSIFPLLMELVVMGAVLLHFGHAEFLGILAVSVIGYGIAFVVGIGRIAGPARAVSAANIGASAIMTDGLLNAEMIKTFTGERIAQSRYDRALLDLQRSWHRFYRNKMIHGFTVATIMALSLLATVLLATHKVTTGAMTVGDFVLVHSYLLQILRPIEMLGFAAQDMTQGVAFIQEMTRILRQEKEHDLKKPLSPLSIGPGELVFEDVSFSFNGGTDRSRAVLEQVSFTARAGETIGLVGPSGAGKSTVVRLLLRLLEPNRGRILLDGGPIRDMPFAVLRQSIAIVPQDITLFNDTIGANIAFGRPESTKTEIEDAAQLAGIHEPILDTPDGYDTMVGERGLKLSGGEKQRIAIARAALKRPRIWIFDEATSSLDSQTEREILAKLTAITKEATTLIISHRLAAVTHANEILVFHEGRIVEHGRHADLITRNGLYAKLWDAQGRENCMGRVIETETN